MNQIQHLSAVQKQCTELTGSASDYDRLLEDIGDASIVLLGEATHGTHEFYSARAQITTRLIQERGFGAIVVEADWPDAYRINRFIRALGDMNEPIEALNDFRRFPRWMWRNAEVLEFVDTLRDYNDSISPVSRVGFYGMDLYSLYASIDAVIEYLQSVDPKAAEEARRRYSCFDAYAPEAQSYGFAMTYVREDCRKAAVEQLEQLRKKGAEYLSRNGFAFQEEQFYAEQNARLAQNAEEYYRTMFSGRVSSWNLRDTHMADTIDALMAHMTRFGEARIVVWAHNSHLGDARATEVARFGECNVGQLLRERHGDGVFSVGFTTHSGTVAAASSWGGEVERKLVLPSLPESYGDLFHQTQIPSFYLPLRGDPQLSFLGRQHLERAIGVIYMPQSERQSHYFLASLPQQFDSVIHFDQTKSVVPLDREGGWEEGEVLPPTYDSGL
ncbi:erythromycin esterase family protein [Chitinispirillales bacterium ANBcel5]|uniref:erythromycin esterase family protein n=1 Tax=Cellulosispirillum alkaliphilum TaxID=3039283 RepID=UPI002A526794|nr:erythromycin esterase family protein [Chitinispirillales bacterium ANBcel5]